MAITRAALATEAGVTPLTVTHRKQANPAAALAAAGGLTTGLEEWFFLTMPNVIDLVPWLLTRGRQPVAAVVWEDQQPFAQDPRLEALVILGPRPAGLEAQQVLLQAVVPILVREVGVGVVVRSYADWSFPGVREIVVSPHTLPQLLRDLGGLEEPDLPAALAEIERASDLLGGML